MNVERSVEMEVCPYARKLMTLFRIKSCAHELISVAYNDSPVPEGQTNRNTCVRAQHVRDTNSRTTRLALRLGKAAAYSVIRLLEGSCRWYVHHPSIYSYPIIRLETQLYSALALQAPMAVAISFGYR